MCSSFEKQHINEYIFVAVVNISHKKPATFGANVKAQHRRLEKKGTNKQTKKARKKERKREREKKRKKKKEKKESRMFMYDAKYQRSITVGVNCYGCRNEKSLKIPSLHSIQISQRLPLSKCRVGQNIALHASLVDRKRKEKKRRHFTFCLTDIFTPPPPPPPPPLQKGRKKRRRSNRLK